MPKIPEEYLGKIKLYNNPKKGLASVRNFGLQLASFEYILFIDNDIIIMLLYLIYYYNLLPLLIRYPIGFNPLFPPKSNCVLNKLISGSHL